MFFLVIKVEREDTRPVGGEPPKQYVSDIPTHQATGGREQIHKTFLHSRPDNFQKQIITIM